MKFIKVRAIVEGYAEGPALISKEPISFYGGIDPRTGVIREKGHPLEGKTVKNTILIFPYGKGSTVGSYVLLSLAKHGVAPKAIVNLESEPIIVIGCLLAKIPLVDKPQEDVFKILNDNENVKVIANKENAYICIEKR
ncbi:MAG: hypothetical protein DRJ44_03240 [Thermoprotei archaeon]|nr:MAG: hypothetical protein DRJ44_03240 [Thermoprotei archaeon]